MFFEEKTITLKDGRKAQLASPLAEDAAAMNKYIKTCAGETNFILRCPEECTETAEQEQQYLQRLIDAPLDLMLVCKVDGEIAGNCRISMNGRIKTKHRASVGIGLIQKYWNLGIGTAMFKELIAVAREHGVQQLELEYIEGNTRACALYEKMGFKPTGEKPDAIRLPDGTMLKETQMMLKL